MHEIGLLYQTAKTASRFAQEHEIERIYAIELEIGELTGVLPDVFKEYFPYVAGQFPVLKDAVLKLDMIEARGICEQCHAVYNIMKHRGICPNCGSSEKMILGGNQMLIRQIEY